LIRGSGRRCYGHGDEGDNRGRKRGVEEKKLMLLREGVLILRDTRRLLFQSIYKEEKKIYIKERKTTKTN